MKDFSIYSFYHDNVPPNVAKYQKLVFDKFKIPLIQFISNDITHGDALTYFINRCQTDYIVFFDIDCIPLQKDVIDILYSQIKDGNTIAGAIGCANHLDPNFLYIHPCFMGFKKQLYYDCNEPNMGERYFDVGGKFTYDAQKYNKNVKFWNITSCDNKIWDISPLNIKFGHGCVYEKIVYHQFEIRKFSNKFIDKCKEVL